jgi:hypothetical protein
MSVAPQLNPDDSATTGRSIRKSVKIRQTQRKLARRLAEKAIFAALRLPGE